MKKWKEINWFDIFSLGKEDNVWEFQLLEKCVQDAVKRNPKGNVLEIGSFHGLTANMMAQYAPVICIDVWSEDSLETEAQKTFDVMGVSESWRGFQKNRVDNGCLDRIFPICATSAVLDILPPLNLELCFIDGCHSAPWPLLDAQRCERHMSKTGIIAFHDAMRGYVKEYEKTVKSVDECVGHGWGYPPTDRMTFDPWQGVADAVKEMVKGGKWKPYDKVHGMLMLQRA